MLYVGFPPPKHAAVITSVLLLSLTASAGVSFGPPVNYPAGRSPWAIASADLNNDGKLDLVVTNDIGGNFRSTVSVLLGNGDGTFQPAVTYKVGPSPTSVAIGDFNHDGKLDLAVASQTGTPNGYGLVTVLLGNGDGTFQPGVNYSAGQDPYYVVSADFNLDGRLDLAVTNPAAGAKGYVAVLQGNGDGTFKKPVKYSGGGAPTGLAVGDFNGDGKPDLVAADNCLCRSGAVSVLLGKGDGTFNLAVSYPVSTRTGFVAVGDLNGDGKQDLVAVQPTSDAVSVLLGNGDGTFQHATSFGVDKGPTAVAISDLSGDGIPDLAATNETSGDVSVLVGNGDGTFQATQNFAISGYDLPLGITVGDFNGDNKNDLAVADGGANAASVLLNTGQ
jgi:hypothetical protein